MRGCATACSIAPPCARRWASRRRTWRNALTRCASHKPCRHSGVHRTSLPAKVVGQFYGKVRRVLPTERALNSSWERGTHGLAQGCPISPMLLTCLMRLWLHRLKGTEQLVDSAPSTTAPAWRSGGGLNMRLEPTHISRPWG